MVCFGTLDEGAVDALLARAAQEVDQGRLPSCQLAVAVDGELALSATFGAADDDSRYSVFSVTKALVAAAVWVLLGEGPLTAETPVCQVVEGFDGAKQRVTLAHVMSHTGGFPRAPMSPEEGSTSAGRTARFARWRLDGEPGEQTEYHPNSAHWVLAEVIEQLSGMDYRAFVAERVLAPLGLSRLRLGVPEQDQHDVLDIVLVGSAGRVRPGIPVLATDEAVARYNDPAVRAVGVPGSGAVSDAADVALLYQALLHDPAGLWEPDVLADATGRVRNSLLDPWTGVPANRTLGLVVAGDDGHAVLREFGREAGPRAFGASGLGGQIAWADPHSGLSLCYLTNGLESDPVASFLRSADVSTSGTRCRRVSHGG